MEHAVDFLCARGSYRTANVPLLFSLIMKKRWREMVRGEGAKQRTCDRRVKKKKTNRERNLDFLESKTFLLPFLAWR